MLLWNAWCRKNHNKVYSKVEVLFTLLILVISSLIIDHLLDHYPQEEAVGVACFYCDYHDQSNQTIENILGSLLRQFLTSCANSSVYDSWTNTIESIDRRGRRVALADILGLMKLVLDSLKLAFVCIDALDELEPHVRNQLLVEIQKFA